MPYDIICGTFFVAGLGVEDFVSLTEEQIRRYKEHYDIWRLQTHAQFGGTWLSDYVPNRLGGFVQEQRPQRPKMELLGQDGNIFAILGRASALLKRAGMKDQADEMFQRVTASGSYEQALNIISEYVETELTPPPIHQKSNKKKARDAHER